jgi:hypothetical protein
MVHTCVATNAMSCELFCFQRDLEHGVSHSSCLSAGYKHLGLGGKGMRGLRRRAEWPQVYDLVIAADYYS